MTTEKQYTKAEAYEFLIENPEMPLYFRFCNDEGQHWVKYYCDRRRCKFHRKYSWDEEHHGLHFTLYDGGPFYETPEPPKPEPEYELPECLSVEALRQLYVGKRPVWEDESTFARHIMTEARRLDAEVLIQARKDAAEMIAEAMLSKRSDA